MPRAWISQSCSDPPSTAFEQPLEQLLLGLRGVILADVAGLARRFDLAKLRLDRALVVVLGLRLLEDLLRDPHGPRHRRERELEDAGDQPHAAAPTTCSEAKLYGGMGPRKRSCTFPASCSATAPTSRPNSSTRPRSTRKAALTAPSTPPAGSRVFATTSASSRSC